MKSLTLALSAAALMAIPATLPASAQSSSSSSSSTTIIQRDQSPPAGVVIEERKPSTIVEERSTETTGTLSECRSKSVTTENAVGDSTTVTKKSCD